MTEVAEAPRRGDIELCAPRGLRTCELDAGAEQYLVLSYPVRRFQLPPTLTTCEAEVVTEVLEGKSRSQIARRRGSSVATVANLLAQAFRKLGVSSRQELAAQLRVVFQEEEG